MEEQISGNFEGAILSFSMYSVLCYVRHANVLKWEGSIAETKKQSYGKGDVIDEKGIIFLIFNTFVSRLRRSRRRNRRRACRGIFALPCSGSGSGGACGRCYD